MSHVKLRMVEDDEARGIGWFNAKGCVRVTCTSSINLAQHLRDFD